MSHLKRLLLVLAGAVALAACGGSDDSADEAIGVRPFAEIQANEFTFEVDEFDPSRAIFRVRTTEPAICAIVWGETEALGSFNNSLAMNGTGIVDHDVFLPGASPGETYYFQVQGSTADGTLYQSELATFTVPEVDGGAGDADSTDNGTTIREVNLALSATIADVSSEFSSSWAAANAIDDDLSTEWSSSGDGDDAFITVDLGSPNDIGGVEYLTRSMADGTAITTTYWVTIDDGERLGPFAAGNPAETNFQAIQASGQVVRFEAQDTTGGNTGAVEIRVFAPAP
jgi:hypothetical protein